MSANRFGGSPSGTSSPSAGANRSKRKPNNDLFRNYYGLDNTNEGISTSNLGTPSSSIHDPISNVQQINTNQDPLDPDSESFQIDMAFKSLMQKRSLAQLIKEESDLLTDIRELDGERQSLVYNHHHELVFASETMRNMKEQADALLPSLNNMQSSLQSISSTSESLVLSEKDHNAIQKFKEEQKRSPNKKSNASSLDVLQRAQPVIQLPQRLRDLILLENGQRGLNKAQGLWGSLESVLASWDEAGVKGAKEIMNECRQVLREAQQSVNAV